MDLKTFEPLILIVNMGRESITINGIELRDDVHLWRLKGLNTINKSINSQDPESILYETSKQLAENHPDEVDNASFEEVKSNLESDSKYYDGTYLMRYHAMEVVDVKKGNDPIPTEITIRDLKEQKDFIFTSSNDIPQSSSYKNWEPLDALEKHLGTTIFPEG